MFAYDPPAVTHPAPASDQQDVIEVVGTRADQALKIDRRTYQVKQTPHSQQKDAIQLMRGLPAVTISPDDQINLLGAGNVKILIDGRPYSGDATQYLRTLHGTDIDRIEIVTNPSAQYSAEGTGGIINIVLRKKQGEGISGTASAEVSNFGRGEFNSTTKYKHGKWTYEIATHGLAGKQGHSTYHKLRSIEVTPGGPSTINTESGGGRAHEWRGDISAKLTYEIDSRTSLSGKIWGGGGTTISTDDVQFRGVTSDFQSFTEYRRKNADGEFFISEFGFDHKGSKDGESLKASAQFFGNPEWRERTESNFSDGSSLSILLRNRWLFGHSQVDWDHPLGKHQILSVGASWDIGDTSQHYLFASVGRDGSLGPNSADQYHALSNTLAAYWTFQQPVGSWTLMPGLRIERNSRHVSSPGLPEVRVDHDDVFPTLHLQHALSKTLNLTLSYSKRIDRAPIEFLRPYGAVEDVITIFQGNPNLKDQSIDAYEANLHYHRNKVDAGLIAYDRETSGLWMPINAVTPAGVSVRTIVNAGHRRDSGAEFDLSTPIAGRFKGNVSINLFEERGPIDTAGGREMQEIFRYTSNGTLEWDGPDNGKTPGDVAQLQFTYNGRERGFQYEAFGWEKLTLSYTHSFSRTLSLSGTFDYSADFRHQLAAPLEQELYDEHPPVEFKIKLLKTFGKL